MRTALALLGFIFLAIPMTGRAGIQQPVSTPPTGSNETYLTIHNVSAAHEITLGAGARVGILDRSFGMDAHPGLFAGGEVFWDADPDPEEGEETHHGFWMALVLHEIAPKAEIYALDVHAHDEGGRVEAVVRALEWAVANELDVVTYCSGGFSQAAKEVLDPVVEQTVKAGVVVVFVDYYHPMNLLPAGFGPTEEAGPRDPDLNIFSYDCTTLFANQFVALLDPDDDGIRKYRPFLARSSAGPVTAGLVALVRSVNPDASPAEIKEVLRETSHSMEYRGRLATHVPDAFEAVTKAVGFPVVF